MPDVKKATAAVGFGTAFATMALAVLANVVIVVVAAASGLLIGYLFPQTIFDALTLLGLGKFALWQAAVGVAALTVTLRPLTALFK